MREREAEGEREKRDQDKRGNKERKEKFREFMCGCSQRFEGLKEGERKRERETE